MRLFIVGAGGFGREVLAYARDAGKDAVDGAPLTVAGFLDDRPDALAGFDVTTSVVGTVADARPGPDDRYVIAIGDPRLRWKLAGALEARGARFAAVVHPLAYVAPGARLGVGVVLAPFAFVGPQASLGSHAVLNTYASVGHDAVVGRCAVLSPYAVINGGTRVGEGGFFGTHATLVVGRSLGAWAKLGAGAVALADVPPGALAVGSPAKGRVLFSAPDDPGPQEA